ncbi:hypothetical protein LMJF_33_3020 [Leishmania major strain Friedlin]|uniref:Uncharacterized protein n=1 Tax=Leishmania major TaxID=5664 RepID=Q4Q3N4_LEIMA|nr:hypothetical protein LMJF_33_3020 [Leishmania major strain Friedlin]CAG9581001.1 hypothetical_protein_-_conserved [Leishmania major strain Friedlin]CAJ06842.1 hypothetical protein LMJF_33_3020 [Leishmania major strain Friedlin]|eukprot:XP_001686064.1 hypothetical protein LMJF_33_3020 [Leishmania major strain Friedlin]
MTSVASTLYRASDLRGSVAMETNPDASRLGTPNEFTASVLIKRGKTREHRMNAVMERDGASTAQDESQLLKEEARNAWCTQDAFVDFDTDSSDSDAQSGGKTDPTSAFMDDGSASSDSCYASFYTSKGDDSDTSLDDTPSPSYGEYEESNEYDDEAEEDEGLVGSDASRINGNSFSSTDPGRNISVMFGVSRSSVSPEQRSSIKGSSVSALPPFTISGAPSSHGTHVALLVTGVSDRPRRARGSAASMMMPPYTTTTVLNPSMSVSLVLSAFGTFSNGTSAPPADLPVDLRKHESGNAGTRHPQSLERNNSMMFSQMYFTGSEAHQAEARSPLYNDHGCDRSNQELPTLAWGDEKRRQMASMMQMETMLPLHAHANRVSHNEDSVDGGIYGFWPSDDKKSEDAMSTRPLVSKMNSTLPSFLRYADARSPCTIAGETRAASCGTKQGDKQLKTCAGGRQEGRNDHSSNSTGRLPRGSSLLHAHTRNGGSSPGEAFLSDKALSPNAIIGVLRGDFDNRDISLDSRFLDTDPHHKSGSTSMEAKGHSRQPPASSRHAVTADGTVDRHGASTATVGDSETSSGHRVEEPVRRRRSGDAILSICRTASFGHPRESFSVTRSLSSGQAHSLGPVPSQQTLIGVWRLLSFREQGDTPLTNVEHVPQKRTSKKKHSKDKKRSKKHEKHRRPRHTAEGGHVGIDTGRSVDARDDANRDDGAHVSAAPMCKESDTMRSPARLSGVSAAGGAPAECHTGVTCCCPSSPPGLGWAAGKQGSLRSSMEANGQPLRRHQAVLQDLSMGAPPARKGTPPTAGNLKIRLLPSRVPVRTVFDAPDTLTAPHSHNSSAEKVDDAAANAHVPQPSGADVARAVGSASVDAAQKPDRFEKFEEPSVESPTATVRRLTVRSGSSKALMNHVRGCNTSSDSDGSAQRLLAAPATQVRLSVSPPNGRLRIHSYDGLAAHNGERSLRSLTRPQEGLPPL